MPFLALNKHMILLPLMRHHVEYMQHVFSQKKVPRGGTTCVYDPANGRPAYINSGTVPNRGTKSCWETNQWHLKNPYYILNEMEKPFLNCTSRSYNIPTFVGENIAWFGLPIGGSRGHSLCIQMTIKQKVN